MLKLSALLRIHRSCDREDQYGCAYRDLPWRGLWRRFGLGTGTVVKGRVGQHTCQSPFSHSCSTSAQMLLRSLHLSATRTRTLSRLWDRHTHWPTLPCLHLPALTKFVNRLTVAQAQDPTQGSSSRANHKKLIKNFMIHSACFPRAHS
jgi:hypothetical protein